MAGGGLVVSALLRPARTRDARPQPALADQAPELQDAGVDDRTEPERRGQAAHRRPGRGRAGAAARGGDPPPLPEPPTKPRDPRLPPVGTVIRRGHKGEVHEITVLDDGFEYEGRHYTSLSTIAREVTGTSWNGFLWAGLTKRKKRKRGDAGEDG
ncbi:MAG: DUF2924 domain-containing protein [Sandaracinaceae bacterium]